MSDVPESDLYLQLVRLRSDRYRADGVAPGTEGVVVLDLAEGVYEVEFSNLATGETIAMLTLHRAEIEPVGQERSTALPGVRASG